MSGDFLKVESVQQRNMRMSVIRSKNVNVNEFGIPSVSLMENLEKSQRLSRMFQIQALEKRVSTIRPKAQQDSNIKVLNTENSDTLPEEKDKHGDELSPLSPTSHHRNKHSRSSQVESLFKRSKAQKNQAPEKKETVINEIKEVKEIIPQKKLSSAFENRRSIMPMKRESTVGGIPLNMMARKSSMFRREDDLKSLTQKDIMKNLDLDLFTQEQLIEMAIVILNKASGIRTAIDIKIAKKCTQNVKFFQDIIRENGEEIHEQCCKYMTYKMLKTNEVLFYEGNIGTSFYIILKGSVGINKFDKRIQESIQSNFKKMKTAAKKKLPDPQTPKATPKTSIFELANNLFLKGKPDDQPNLYDMQDSLDRMVPPDLDQRGALVEVKQLGAGSAFGELALMDNKPRAATIICKEDSHFAVLDKHFFNQILKEAEQRKLDSQLLFFASMKIFEGMSYNAVKNLYYYSTQIEYIRNQYVYHQNDPSEELFLIKSGEFKIVKGFTSQDSPLRAKSQVEDDIPKLLLKRTKFSTPKLYEVAILGEGETFGEEEIILNSKRKFSVLCNSQKGVLFVLNKKEFFKRVFSEDKVNQILKRQINNRTEWRGKRVESYIMSSQLLSPEPRDTPFQEGLATVSMNDVFKEEPQILSDGEYETNHISSVKRTGFLESIFDKKGGKGSGGDKSQKEVMKKLMIHFNKNRVKTQGDNIRSYAKRKPNKHKTTSPKVSRGAAMESINILNVNMSPSDEQKFSALHEIKKVEMTNHDAIDEKSNVNEEHKLEVGNLSLKDYFNSQKLYGNIQLPLKPNSENIKFSESMGNFPIFKSPSSQGHKKLRRDRPYFMSGAKTDRLTNTLENTERSSEIQEFGHGKSVTGFRTTSELGMRKKPVDLFINCEGLKKSDTVIFIDNNNKPFTPKKLKNSYFDIKKTKSKLALSSTSPKPFDSSIEQRPHNQTSIAGDGSIEDLKQFDGLETVALKASIEIPQNSGEKTAPVSQGKTTLIKFKSDLLPLKYIAESISENSITKASQIKRVIRKYSVTAPKSKKYEPVVGDFCILIEKMEQPNAII